LPLGPLPGAFGLEFAFGDIVHGAIAGDTGRRVAFCDILGTRAHDDAELDLPVRFLGFGRDGYIIEGSRETTHLFGEDDELRRGMKIEFGSMIGIIEADSDEFLWIGNRRADARIAGHDRKRSRIKISEPLQTSGRDGIAGYVSND